ncbi:hypothetical protein GQ607_017114 [Colletotrichum asianum]|uniref:Nucleoside phosphorylase domain-containing protein n=1 Tax=Colletotrichum asianum TaxID=702518 RepID=A0A8H3VXN1_9PEZI|nr:hypothetical protein GQ607_017114 [Colletotrichum asianum]
MADSTRLPTYKMYTIGWIAALDKELTAALAMLDETHRQPDDFEQNDKDSNNYSWGRVGDHNIVIASLGGESYGLVSAATTATCMANSLPHLRFGLLVGIGAGVPDLEENDVRLGDVVVSLPKNGHPGVVQYDLGKLRVNDQFQRVGALAPPPTVLLKAVDKLRAEQRLKGSKLPEILSQAVQNYPMLANPKGRDPAFIYQGAKNDRLFEPTSVHVPGGISCRNLSGGIKRRRIGGTESCDGCDAEREIKREERSTSDPEIHYGTIASGNSVIKDGVFRDKVLKRLGTDVLCYEMEAAGLNYAALVAAAYAKDLLCVVEARTIEKADRLEEIMTSVSRHTSQIISATTNTNQAVQGLTDSQQSQKLHRWLCAPDPSVNFNWAISQHLSGTGEWFLESEEYRRWKTSPVRNNHVHTVKLLLQSITKAEHLVQSKCNVLNQVLQSVVFGFNGASGEIVKVLLDYGADINAIVSVNASPLCEVLSRWETRRLWRKLLKILETLIQYGADVNERGTNGTPLEVALQKEYWTIAEALIKKGAEVTPLCRALQPRDQQEANVRLASERALEQDFFCYEVGPASNRRQPRRRY